MIGLKSIGIAIAILCSLLVVGVQNSEAIKIVEFPSDTEEYSYNGITYHQ